MDSSQRDLSKNVHILMTACTIGPLCLKQIFSKNHVFGIFTLSLALPRRDLYIFREVTKWYILIKNKTCVFPIALGGPGLPRAMGNIFGYAHL